MMAAEGNWEAFKYVSDQLALSAVFMPLTLMFGVNAGSGTGGKSDIMIDVTP